MWQVRSLSIPTGVLLLNLKNNDFIPKPTAFCSVIFLPVRHVALCPFSLELTLLLDSETQLSASSHTSPLCLP